MRPHRLSIDTSAEIEQRLIDGWRTMTPAQKAGTVIALTTAAMDMTRIGIRHRHPADSALVHDRRLAEILYGTRTAGLLFPDRRR